MRSHKMGHPSKALNEYSDNETMADWFMETLYDEVNDEACERFRVSSNTDWINNKFEVEWVSEDGNDPSGIKFSCDNDFMLRNSAIPGLCRILDDCGYTYIRATDKRFKDNRGDKEIIVTGHMMTGGKLPTDIKETLE